MSATLSWIAPKSLAARIRLDQELHRGERKERRGGEEDKKSGLEKKREAEAG